MEKKKKKAMHSGPKRCVLEVWFSRTLISVSIIPHSSEEEEEEEEEEEDDDDDDDDDDDEVAFLCAFIF